MVEADVGAITAVSVQLVTAKTRVADRVVRVIGFLHLDHSRAGVNVLRGLVVVDIIIVVEVIVVHVLITLHLVVADVQNKLRRHCSNGHHVSVVTVRSFVKSSTNVKDVRLLVSFNLHSYGHEVLKNLNKYHG